MCYGLKQTSVSCTALVGVVGLADGTLTYGERYIMQKQSYADYVKD
jgi:hypothetical protein